MFTNEKQESCSMEEPMSDSIQHFSHQHTLHYVRSPTDKNNVCSGCKLTITPGKFYYQCKPCGFFLHKVCYRMPKKVLHPADQNHRLTLLDTPTSNCCEACGRSIPGFCYSCTKCNKYYHMLCIALPLSLKLPASHPHMLKLQLKPPYDFQCDLCHKSSHIGWLYTCRLCEFDAHIFCAVTYNKGIQSSSQKVHSSKNGSAQNELMEILSQGLMVMEEKICRNAVHEPQDQSIMVSENFTLPSYQFSDACFSIEITKSIQRDEQQVGKSVRRELSLAPSLSVIGSQVWAELDHPKVDKSQYKHLISKTKDAIPRRPFWSKLLKCL